MTTEYTIHVSSTVQMHTENAGVAALASEDGFIVTAVTEGQA